ncbi:MAG: hypothetical protein GEV11_28165 [Streptosporangiales bacterium]|nr:hypothetical protein [Streptosporangiales bacterium]
MQRPTIRVAGVCSVGLGLVSGVAIVLTPTTVRSSPVWVVWAALAITLTTTAGAVFAYGLGRWAELTALRPVRARDVVLPLAGLLAAGVLAALVSIVVTAMAHQAKADWSAVRGWALTLLAGLGTMPAIATMYGIRQAAGDTSAVSAKGEQVAALVASRGLLQRLLAAVGSLVALATLALGAAFAVRQSLPTPSPGPQPAPQTVLIFGGAGSMLVALAYGPAATALRNRGRRLCDELFPVHEADEAEAILRIAEDRNKLEQLLGVDRTVVTDLQTGLTILGPLVASAAASLLPP